ncbi:pyruvate/2-oxoglutarate dehydrogenase complex dihydrolipoamide dehydrogenase (E3) component [Prosthecobacter fusiformis]|uniref:Pyruvate/2-oxoglutarate dehydrogenase complex dihydrolipoamide dehydrogenase (E3) component n=1 Tax=Prosthecobacter fusiformis TaxID=48464 RepID=A0A4R7SSA1_9BACT|nr:FAD-dependent oxidoreductase [Prosthecobacter fusiformis]TDU81376.1 pyruvate/2-oxoglutarate dehydrogenase complex dihydrolipoamide dehydrogenase (E3) component [Prosthecobacter fusiformis]
MNTDLDPASHFDFIVIGGGSGGYAAARTAHSLGMSVAIIDGAAELGGLCILRGCMPSKTLIESADRNLSIRRAAEFGLKAQPLGADIRAIRDRKRTLIADFASYRQGQLEDGRFVIYRGHASFVDAHTLEVLPRDGSASFQVRGKTFCIATGSVASVPPIPGLAEAGFWTSDEVLDTDTLPETFAVLGGGAIALEMAHYLEGVGRKVTLIQRSEQFLTGLDPECSAVIEKAYAHRGMTCHLGTSIHRISTVNGRKHIEYRHGDKETSVTVDHILVAMGRSPATDGLNLEAAKVSLTKKKIAIQPTMQSTQPHIFAAGDVCSPLDVVHVAIQQGEIAARNAHRLIHGKAVEEKADYRLLLFGVFSHPQVAAVGAGEEELRKAGTPYVTGSYPFNDHGKSMCMGETEGFVKMLAHRESGEIMGAICVGPQATELVHEVVIAMHYRGTVQDFMNIPHYHPTLSEIWTYPAEECADQING